MGALHYHKPKVFNFVKSGPAQHFVSAGRAGGGECHTNQSGEKQAITITATGSQVGLFSLKALPNKLCEDFRCGQFLK